MNQVPPIRSNFEEPNYDVSKIAPYTLEDPLCFADGTPLKSPADWPVRRKEILDIFAREMYGAEPPVPEEMVIDVVEEKDGALAGFAVRTQYRMYFKADRTGPCINWLLYRPRHVKKPVPVILFLNYRGNFELTYDPEIPFMDSWVRTGPETRDNRAKEENRGSHCNPDSDSVFPIGMIIARGYAVLTACYAEVSSDCSIWEAKEEFTQEQFAYNGVFTLWGERDENRTDNITSLGAWAWALSRGLDLAEQNPALNIAKSVVTGCSRLGKAALIAAARDERFAVCVPNQCGGGGVCLAKRDYGENIATETTYFRHWYCKAYHKYRTNPAALLTFDQHLFLAAIAPRPVLVQGFSSSPWMAPESEYLACKAASPVWEFLGKSGMPGDSYPEDYDTSCIGPYLGYVRRSEAHGISAYDWQWMLDFADQAFARA